MVILAWTAEADPRFRTVVLLVAFAALLKAISLLQLILYRASGKALLDNIRQVLRIVTILIVAFFGRRVGFNGLLVGMAAAESIGVVFMFFAMSKTFHSFNLRLVAVDTIRISTAAAIVVSAGAVASAVPIPWPTTTRLGALIKLGEIVIGCLVAVWPALLLTKSVSTAERRTLIEAFTSRRKTAFALGE